MITGTSSAGNLNVPLTVHTGTFSAPRAPSERSTPASQPVQSPVLGMAAHGVDHLTTAAVTCALLDAPAESLISRSTGAAAWVSLEEPLERGGGGWEVLEHLQNAPPLLAAVAVQVVASLRRCEVLQPAPLMLRGRKMIQHLKKVS
eukprot:CAMPEP_0182899860 /NCGR_PEP_ID=MMETSP0034_2-20130328/28360_2 /TAXON_ID=156128 /ORGANISM="Nephroselmis pyriformis, Strain CCMP717" /LENGTH=145 /DNA_ID=CAMNT_0025033935 /DNA_START=245 /DNA_END=681 /DNA_ORIENTATION=-